MIARQSRSVEMLPGYATANVVDVLPGEAEHRRYLPVGPVQPADKLDDTARHLGVAVAFALVGTTTTPSLNR